MKRSQQKRMTIQSKIIRYLRLSKGISQGEAAARCRLSEAAIGHYEHGRMDISPARLERFLEAYGCSRQEFDEYVHGKPIPVLSIKDECSLLLNRIDEQKLRAVHAVLVGFVS